MRKRSERERERVSEWRWRGWKQEERLWRRKVKGESVGRWTVVECSWMMRPGGDGYAVNSALTTENDERRIMNVPYFFRQGVEMVLMLAIKYIYLRGTW